MDNSKTPTPAPTAAPRYIHDTECIQGKCARPTTGCWDECQMKVRPIVFVADGSASVSVPVTMVFGIAPQADAEKLQALRDESDRQHVEARHTLTGKPIPASSSVASAQEAIRRWDSLPDAAPTTSAPPVDNSTAYSGFANSEHAPANSAPSGDACGRCYYCEEGIAGCPGKKRAATPAKGVTRQAPTEAQTLPAGWTVKRTDKPPFRSITVKSPDGKVALLSSIGRNPENVFYEFADALLQADLPVAAPEAPASEQAKLVCNPSPGSQVSEWFATRAATTASASRKIYSVGADGFGPTKEGCCGVTVTKRCDGCPYDRVQAPSREAAPHAVAAFDDFWQSEVGTLPLTKATVRKAWEAATRAALAAQPVAAHAVPEKVRRALGDARDTAMRNTVAARVPECGDFGAIAQNLDWAINELDALASHPSADLAAGGESIDTLEFANVLGALLQADRKRIATGTEADPAWMAVYAGFIDHIDAKLAAARAAGSGAAKEAA